MNPECQIDLFQGDTSVGEMAHIKPNADGGTVSFDNLIILCRNCHARLDSQTTAGTEQTLIAWKSDRNREIRKQFARVYRSFEELEAEVVPILQRNRSIFDTYGPRADCPDDSQRRDLWLKSEGEIVANNEKLVTILQRNKSMFPSGNWETVRKLMDHAQEFVQTRDDPPSSRANLYPPAFNSIFGIEQVADRFPPSVSALQNMIRQLNYEGRFISLELVKDQVLTYMKGGTQVTLHLNDRPRVDQTYWAGRYYLPKTTNLRLESLVFMLRWLDQRKIHYRFKAADKLTELTLNEKVNVFLCYEYYVTVESLLSASISDGFIVVNLHNWNDGPFSEEAVEYASDIGVRTMNHKQFYVFAHNNLV